MARSHSQSVASISESMAYEAKIRRELMDEPKVLVALPESVVNRWSQVDAPQFLTLDGKHVLVAACRDALGESNDQ